MAAITGTTSEDRINRQKVVEKLSTMNGVSIMAMRIIINVVALCGQKGYCFASNKTLSERINMSEKQIQRGLSDLRKLNAIKYSESGVRKIYIDDNIFTNSKNEPVNDPIKDQTFYDQAPDVLRPPSPKKTGRFTTPITTKDIQYVLTTKEENIKKNSDDLFFATKIPDYISEYVSKNLMVDSDEQKLNSQLFYDGKYSVVYQILATKKTANLVHLKPYMELIPDDVLHNFSQTLVYAFNNSKSLKHKQEIIKFAIHLLYDNNSQIPLQSAMGLKLNFTELSMSKFSGLRISEGMDVRDRMAEVNSQLKTIDRYLDFPSAMIAYWSHGKTMERKNKFANA